MAGRALTQMLKLHRKHKDAAIFENHLNPELLVFIG